SSTTGSAAGRRSAAGPSRARSAAPRYSLPPMRRHTSTAMSSPSTAGSPSRCSNAVSDAFFAANRQNWDERTAIHRQDATGFYRVQAFRDGEDTLYPIEAGEIGHVDGRRLAHLQCHFGLDTLSLARRGAIVTGLDFSPVAIDAARALAA